MAAAFCRGGIFPALAHYRSRRAAPFQLSPEGSASPRLSSRAEGEGGTPSWYFPPRTRRVRVEGSVESSQRASDFSDRSLRSLPAPPFGLRRDESLTRDDNLERLAVRAGRPHHKRVGYRNEQGRDIFRPYISVVWTRVVAVRNSSFLIPHSSFSRERLVQLIQNLSRNQTLRACEFGCTIAQPVCTLARVYPKEGIWRPAFEGASGTVRPRRVLCIVAEGRGGRRMAEEFGGRGGRQGADPRWGTRQGWRRQGLA